jgi:hypothetical protein
LAGTSPDKGTVPKSEPRNDNGLILAKLDEILKGLERGVDLRTHRRNMTGKPNSPTKRDTILFASIVSDLEGLKYCSFLDNHRVKPKWFNTGPRSYRESYLASGSYKAQPMYFQAIRDRGLLREFAKIRPAWGFPENAATAKAVAAGSGSRVRMAWISSSV